MKAPERIYISTYDAIDYHSERSFDRDQTYIHEDLAMCWVPVEEANLQDGEIVDIYTVGGVRWAECRFSFASAAFFHRHYTDNKIMVSQVGHIMRIKPPNTNTPI